MDSFFLHTLPSTIASRLECVLIDQLYAEIATFSHEEMLGSVPIWDVDVETFGGKLMSTWGQDVKNDIRTSKSSSWHHARESSYTPCVRRHFLTLVGFTEILIGYARLACVLPGFLIIKFLLCLISVDTGIVDKDLLSPSPASKSSVPPRPPTRRGRPLETLSSRLNLPVVSLSHKLINSK